MKKLRFIIKYLGFLLASGNEHSVHSPFVFHLYVHTVRHRKQFYAFKAIEQLRQQLLKNNKKIQITDWGAGGIQSPIKERTIADLAKTTLKSPLLGQFLFRLTEYFKPQIVLDLGTSLGITTLYLASADSRNKVITFEGCPNTAQEAKHTFETAKATNIHQVIGNLDNTLTSTLQTLPKVDLVFFDANHRYEPTLNYFHACIEKSTTESVFIFDDIHWSDEMEQAWEAIKNHPKAMLTIDFFFVGLVFFRTNQPKQHFKLRL